MWKRLEALSTGRILCACKTSIFVKVSSLQLYSPPEVSPRVSAVKIISSAFTAQSFSALTHCASATSNIFSFPEYLYWKVNLCRLLAMLAVDGIVTVSCSLVLCIHFISPDLFYFRDKCVHLVAFKVTKIPAKSI